MRTLPPIFASHRSRTRALVVLAVLVVALFAASVLVGRYAPWLTDPAAVRRFVSEFGVLAPLAFVALQALQVIVAPIPGQVLGVVSGYLFGALPGTIYSVLGGAIGSTVVFVLARRYGRPFVEDVVHPDTLAAFDDFVDRHGVLAVFLVFLLPGLPDDAICLLAGVTTIPLWQLVAVAVIGRLPGYFLLNLAGANVASGKYEVAAIVLGVLALVSVVIYWRRDALLARFDGRDDG